MDGRETDRSGYTLLIVEDEPVERALLEDMVEHEYPNITEVYTADNGIDALRMAQKRQPDIMLVDINIPGMTGIELIRELSENQFQGQILITTAYDSFQYATKVLKYGGVGYLLKPIMDEELREYLEKCFALIDEKRAKHALERQRSEGMVSICSYAQRYLIQDFLNGNIQESAMKNAYGWAANGQLQARMMRIHFERALPIEKQNELILLCQDLYQPLYRTLLSIEKNELYCMMQPDQPADTGLLEVSVWAFSMSAAREIWKTEQRFWIYVTGICTSYQEMQTYLPELVRVPTESWAGEWKDTVTFEPPLMGKLYSKKEQKIKIQKAVQRIREGNAARVVSLFRQYFEREEWIWEGVFLVLKALLSYDMSSDLAEGVLAVEKRDAYGSLIRWLEERITKPQQHVPMHPVIWEAFQIIQREYASNELSQTDLAERLGMNPAYFSRLFKKETGKKFISAMTEIRMIHAAEFLKQGSTPEETAQRCGYSNRKYFYEAFKMYFGISAIQYQQREREGRL